MYLGGIILNKGISIGIITLFIVSAVSPMVIGLTVRTTEKELIDETYAYNRFNEHYYPEGYLTGQYPLEGYADDVSSREVIDYEDNVVTEKKYRKPQQTVTSGGPMDSPWPMHGHDIRHTGRSPYGTADNPGFEIWLFKTKYDDAKSSPVVDHDGTIYIGDIGEFYAVYPNGTLKWKYEITGSVYTTAPAIEENGIIYIGTYLGMPNCLYALYTSNGTLKWKYETGNHIESSPAIGSDGSIYFGDCSGWIHAVYPNGTRKWHYKTGSVVTSSPAIGEDGTVYCGSHDDYVYAFYPNGTVKWKFNTGSWVHGSPTIGYDETIYIGSDNGYLYALYPNNGTMKWRCQIGAARASPALDENGTLYIGVWEERFYAIYPNGTIKWTFKPGHRIWGSSTALSADGTIYFGTSDIAGSSPWAFDIIALNPDGTEKWRHFIRTSFSSPAIGEDGTVYIGSYRGLRAFGNYDPNAPDAPTIDGPTNGKIGTEYEYNFTTTDPNGDNVYYYINWGDGKIKDWIGPYISGEEIKLNHTYKAKGTYTIRARAKDTDNLWGAWGELEVTMPKNQQVSNMWFLRWLDRFPILQKILDAMKANIGS